MSAFFRTALVEGKAALSAADRQEIEALSGPRPGRFMLQVLLAWAVIAGAIAMALHVEHWAVSMLAILVVGTRQNVLGLLVHEQAHSNFHPRWGDSLANLFCAYPLLLLSVEGYAPLHLTHHRLYSAEGDPDFDRKSGPEWTFPMRGRDLLRLLLADLLLLNTVKMVRGKKLAQPVAVPRRHPSPRWLRPAFLLIGAAVLTLLGGWSAFLLYWVLPLVSLMPVIVRWGAICEHDYARRPVGVDASTAIILQRPWEKLLLPNLNFGLHPYHHHHPRVSFSQLPKVHGIYRRAGLVRDADVYQGYAPYLRAVLGREKLQKQALQETSATG